MSNTGEYKVPEGTEATRHFMRTNRMAHEYATLVGRIQHVNHLCEMGLVTDAEFRHIVMEEIHSRPNLKNGELSND
jgi:hypothetical protein